MDQDATSRSVPTYTENDEVTLCIKSRVLKKYEIARKKETVASFYLLTYRTCLRLPESQSLTYQCDSISSASDCCQKLSSLC